MKNSFRAAAVQDSPVWLDLNASVEKACRLVHEAAKGGAQIVAFPESFLPGFPYWVFTHAASQSHEWHRRLHENAVEVGGEEMRRVAQTCAETKVMVVIGVTERERGLPGTLYNTNVVIGPDGTILGKHRKLVPTFGERMVWSNGDGSTMDVFGTPWGPLGTLCCGENFNTLARFALLAQGERIHVANFPSASLSGGRHSPAELFLHVAPHAYEGKIFSIVSSDFGTPELAEELGVPLVDLPNSYNAISGVIGPDGCWVTEPLVDQRGIAYADCDMERPLDGLLYRDLVGNYNRFDVFDFKINKKPTSGRAISDAP